MKVRCENKITENEYLDFKNWYETLKSDIGVVYGFEYDFNKKLYYCYLDDITFCINHIWFKNDYVYLNIRILDIERSEFLKQNYKYYKYEIKRIGRGWSIYNIYNLVEKRKEKLKML